MEVPLVYRLGWVAMAVFGHRPLFIEWELGRERKLCRYRLVLCIWVEMNAWHYVD
jgi:hypothetical protein